MALKSIGIILGVYILIANTFIAIVNSKLKSSIGRPTGKFVFLLGFLEILAYIIALFFKQPAFIAIWLGLKMAERWSDRADRKPGIINTFLIGNLLTVISAFIGWLLVAAISNCCFIEYTCKFPN